jgi:Flp pilus assembly protein TadD
MGPIGLSDSAGSAPTAKALAMLGSRNPGLTLAAETMLRHPRSAAVHAALGDSFIAHGIKITGGMELRIAVGLDPKRSGDHLRLGTLLAELHEEAAARAELERALASARTVEDAEQARRALNALGPP